eukprot:9481899-Pyramimonas_sp.AAC.1
MRHPVRHCRPRRQRPPPGQCVIVWLQEACDTSTKQKAFGAARSGNQEWAFASCPTLGSETIRLGTVGN